MCVNVQSLTSNYEHVELLLCGLQPFMLICTEARTTDDIGDAEIRVDGYKIIRSNSLSRHTGGIVIYYRQDLIVSVCNNLVFDNNNILVIKVLNSIMRGIWVNVYRSPSSSEAEFLSRLELTIDELSAMNLTINVTGDFNINVHRNNQCATYSNRLKRFESGYALKQLVKKFTRITASSRTIIDLYFTNDKSIKVDVTDENVVADHKMIVIYKERQKREYITKNIVDRSLLTAENYKNALIQKTDNILDDQISDFNSYAGSLINAIDSTANGLVKLKTICVSHSKPWYTEQLKELKKKRNEANKRAIFCDDQIHWDIYKRIKNNYNRQLKEHKNANLCNLIIEAQSDQKKLWRHLKNFIDKRDTPPDTLDFNGQVVTDKNELANRLNEFFVTSIDEIKASIEYVPYRSDITERDITEWTRFNMVTEATLRRILENFRSVSGTNNVNKNVLGYGLDVCHTKIINMINESLKLGIYPDELKYTVITPIPKVKNTNKPEEMRPVNSPHVIDKMIQTHVKNDLEFHLFTNNLIDSHQSAYRAKHSCETALNIVLCEWLVKREKKLKIIAVFLDLSRAFETVDRDILVNVLQLNGIGGTVLEWFRSWLSNRKQFSCYNQVMSNSIEINNGVPQGTPLSSLLFILYLNSVVNYVKQCHINMFADDILLWIESDDLQAAVNKINGDLDQICSFFKMMKLKLNINKTKFMIIGERNPDVQIDLKIGNEKLERVTRMKYLGVVIDDQLTFKEHCEYLEKKIAKKVGFLSRIRNRVNRETSLLLYKSLIAPHYDFCSTILFMLNESNLHSLQKLQNRAMRVILKRPRDSSVTQMLNETGLLTVKQRIHYNMLVFIYRAINELLPPYITSQLVRVEEIQPYALRNNKAFRLPNLTSRAGQKSLWYNGIKSYNEMIEAGVKVTACLKENKGEFEKYVRQRY